MEKLKNTGVTLAVAVLVASMAMGAFALYTLAGSMEKQAVALEKMSTKGIYAQVSLLGFSPLEVRLTGNININASLSTQAMSPIEIDLSPIEIGNHGIGPFDVRTRTR